MLYCVEVEEDKMDRECNMQEIKNPYTILET
jgi:hypothetical protein